MKKQMVEEVKADEQLIDLYTYDCVDRVTRTRCERHIARTGPYRINGREPYHVRRGVDWGRCVECVAEAEQKKRRTIKEKYEQVASISQ